MSRARTCLGALVAGTLLLGLGAGVGGCGSKYHYAPENPRNLASPPHWVAHPLRVTGEGALEVVGEARASEARIAFELAELAGRARAARYFRSLSRAGAASETQVLDGTVLTEEADARASAESVTVEVGGLMPVERWYDTRARRAYVLLRMPAEEHERLRALYRRQAVEGARDLRGAVEVARDPRGAVEGARNAGGERHEGMVHPPATGQAALPSPRPPSPAPASVRTPLATVEALGYRFGAVGCRWSGGVLRCTVAVENLEPEPRRLRVYGTGIRCAGSAVIDVAGNKHCPVVAIGDLQFTPYVAADAFLPGVPLNVHLEARGRRPEGERVTVVLALFRERERQSGKELVTLRGIPLGGSP